MSEMQLRFDLLQGLERKDAGLDQVESTHEDFVPRLRELVKQYALYHGEVTADDARRLAIEHGLRPKHKNAWGAVFRGKGWKKVGQRQSALISNHGHVNPVWIWVGE